MTLDKPDAEFMSNENVQKRVRVMAAVFLAIGWAISYWIWPSGVIDLPLVQITFGAFLRILASGASAFAFLVMAYLLWI